MLPLCVHGCTSQSFTHEWWDPGSTRKQMGTPRPPSSSEITCWRVFWRSPSPDPPQPSNLSAVSEGHDQTFVLAFFLPAEGESRILLLYLAWGRQKGHGQSGDTRVYLNKTERRSKLFRKSILTCFHSKRTWQTHRSTSAPSALSDITEFPCLLISTICFFLALICFQCTINTCMTSL